MSRRADNALVDQEWLGLGLFTMALLLSLFAAGLSDVWSQRVGQRLNLAADRLQTASEEENSEGSELERLEANIERLPLELLKAPPGAADSLAEYESAGLLYIRLNSLSRYVETLDEMSLLRYTELQRKLVAGAAELYGGDVSVCRQFGLLVSFSGSHTAGGPATRAAATAWLLHQVAPMLQLRLKLELSVACAISEPGIGTSADIYPGLYCQHIVDDLAEVTSSEPGQVLLLGDLATDAELISRAQLGGDGERTWLNRFNEPWHELLERQELLLHKQLGQH